MRRLTFVVLLSMAFIVAATPLAEANKYSKKSGSKFKLKAGQKLSVKVSGFQGCTFEVLHANAMGEGATDAKVATVKTSGELAKSQKVTITAAGIGETTVMLETAGKSPSCDGFTATYFISVLPDQKALVKEIKAKMKDVEGSVKTGVNSALSIFCEQIDFISKGVKAGTIDPDDAMVSSVEAMQFVADFLDVSFNQIVNEGYEDVWGCIEKAGYFRMDSALRGYASGGCGDWDKFALKLKKLGDKAVAKMEKKVKALGKTIGKQLAADDDEMIQLIEHIVPNLDLSVIIPLPVPEPQPQPAPVPKPLKKNFTSSGRRSSSETTRLQIGGSADPDGGDVTVEIRGPGDFVESTLATVNDPGCDWEVLFKDLPPGTYTVRLSQAGADPVTFTTLGA